MGRRWLIVSPAQELRLGQLLNMKPMSHKLCWAGQCKQPLCQHSQYYPAVLHSHKCAGVQQTGISAGLCLSFATKRRQAARAAWCAPCEGLCPTPTSQSNCKTKPWTPRESGAKPTVHQLETDKEQTSGTTTLLGIPAAAPALAPLSGTALSSVTPQAVLGAVLQFLLHPTQSCSVSAARRDSRSHLLGGQTHRRLLCEGSSEFHGLAVLNFESVN